MEAPKLIRDFQVRVSEVHFNRKLNLTALADYLQEVAWVHASILGINVPDLLPRNLTWALSRMKIVIDKLPMEGDQITVETWPSGFERFTAFRTFQVLDKTRKIIASATSSWLIFNIKTRRMVEIPEDVRLVKGAGDKHLSQTIPKSSTYTHEMQFSVRLFETDINDHANNVTYFNWLVESIPIEFLKNHEIKRVDIQFKGEAVLGDQIVTRSQPSEDTVFLHQINNQSGKELVRARTFWA